MWAIRVRAGCNGEPMQLMPSVQPARSRIVRFAHARIGQQPTSGARRRMDAPRGAREAEAQQSWGFGALGRGRARSAPGRCAAGLRGLSGSGTIRTYIAHQKRVPCQWTPTPNRHRAASRKRPAAYNGVSTSASSTPGASASNSTTRPSSTDRITSPTWPLAPTIPTLGESELPGSPWRSSVNFSRGRRLCAGRRWLGLRLLRLLRRRCGLARWRSSRC